MSSKLPAPRLHNPLPAHALDTHGGPNVDEILLSSICWAGLFVLGH